MLVWCYINCKLVLRKAPSEKYEQIEIVVELSQVLCTKKYLEQMLLTFHVKSEGLN